MAYATTNPPRALLGDSQFGSHPTVWQYESADAAATVAAANYFSNGYDLGLKVNDLIFVIDTATPLVTTHRVSAVTTDGAATVSAGVTVGNT